jgi:hypothetical protein
MILYTNVCVLVISPAANEIPFSASAIAFVGALDDLSSIQARISPGFVDEKQLNLKSTLVTRYSSQVANLVVKLLINV